jgi:hypothetical protein
MLNQENIDELNKVLLDHAKSSPTILGARLGDIVKKQFPGENIKKNYGSVANFVNRNFASMLTQSGRHGIDNIYSFSEEVLNGDFDFQRSEGPSNAEAVGVVAVNAEKSQLKSHDTTNDSSESLLREAIIGSVRLMTVEQLRQLPIPAGILLDAIRKANRF